MALQMQLAAARFATEPFARWTRKLVGTVRWHVATQAAIFEAVIATPHSAEDLERGEAVWAASEDDASRWIALRILVWVATERGWSDERRQRLRCYREDKSPLVADEAAFVFPPDPKLASART